MADFFTKALARPSEELELLGDKIVVRGLSMGELVELSRQKKGETPKDNLTLTCELIARCSFNKKTGKPLFEGIEPSKIPEINPGIYHALNDVVSRVNAAVAGNSKATGGEGSSSA